MRENYPPIIETTDVSAKNNFPIIAQLFVLFIMLLMIFSGYFLNKKSNVDDYLTNENSPNYTTDNNTYPITSTIKNIENINIQAKSAYVWDVRGQRALYSKNSDEILPLASITKLMTTLLSYELIESDKTATVPKPAVLQESSGGLSVGEKFSFDNLLKLSLVSSANGAAYTLGANVGALLGDNDALAQFIKAMNIRADEIGLQSLEFWNTTGLDLSPTKPGAVGNARDVSFLMEYIIENYPELIDETQMKSLRIYNVNGEYHDIENTNPAVSDIPNLIASKTGYTDLAGGNLTVVFDAGFNRPIIVTVLGSTHSGRFDDVLTLVKAIREVVSINENY